MIKTIQSSTLRNNQANTLNALKKEKVLVITRNGNADSAIVDLDYLEDLLALSSKKYRKAIREGRADFKAGRYYTFEEVFGDL